MNRKSTRPGNQHDISIIGNLPERLKKKIADKAKVDGLENYCLNAASSAVAVAANIDDDDEINGALNGGEPTGLKNVQSGAVAVPGEMPNVDFFLNYDQSQHAVSCNIGKQGKKLTERHTLDEVERSIPGILRLNNKKTETNHHIAKKQREERPPNATIPGIIRLNGAAEHVRLGKGHQHVGKAIVEERPRSHVKVLKQPKKIDAPLPLSPAHSFSSKKYPAWFDDAQIESFSADLRQLYDTFTGLIEQHAVQQHWSYFNETRAQLLLIFKQIVLQHLKFCCEMKCDSLFWKLLFYNVREFLKLNNVSPPQHHTTHDNLLELIDDGIAFYMDLIKCLKLKYLKAAENSTLKSESNSVSVKTTTQKSDKFEFIAKVVAQKLFINLGDLWRYKALHLKSSNLSEAANFYREAQILIPTNGIPYNQLAIVAIHDRKKFEAIYLHMRSLMSSNAINSAKESLLVLFDEIRKKFEKTEPKISPVHQYKHTNNANSGGSGGAGKVISPLRKEVWIHPDGVRRLHRTNIDGRKSRLSKPAKNIEIRLDEMSNEDLLHRFISIYLYMIGKLYTGIGMETVQAHQNKLLTQLSALLKKEQTPLLLTRSKMLKIVALNIFILHHNLLQARREIRYYTFTFCNQIFGVILQKCNQMFGEFSDDTVNEKLERRKGLKDLNTLLQFVKIYTDYLSLNVDIWEPIRKEEQYFIDPWSELQNLFEHLENFSVANKEKLANVSNDDVILEENQFLYGFTPLSTLQPKYFHTNRAYASEPMQFLARVLLLRKFQAHYLEYAARLQTDENDADSSFVLEELDVEIKTALETLHKVAAATTSDESESELMQNKSQATITATTTMTMTTAAAAAATLENDDNATVDQRAHLSKLKKELEQQTNAKRSYNAKLEEILNYVDTKVYIEVRPKYLMPDTNCFIDCLDDFEQLLKNYKRYVLVIPLTVVRELDGLSKGIKPESRPHFMQKHRIHHFDDVSTCAKRSLDFIKNTKQNVKCVTSKGSIINASLFALVEEDYMSNDDRILATALALSKTMCRETSKDDKCFIQTQLVLITTDRNLRVKALSRNLAVSELDEFLLWARDCNEV